ncbi:MAG: alkaline phosphatase family protein, partial [Myxococcales bacterium]
LVSLSGNDLLLHNFGPDSAEAAESMAALDAGIGELLAMLDRTVGRERYVFALTADHGGGPAIEVAQARGLGGGRMDLKKMKAQLDAKLSAKFGGREWVQAFTESGIYLREDGGADPDAVRAEAAKALLAMEGVVQVFRRGAPAEWQQTSEGRAAARGYSARHGGDLVAALAPYWIWEEDCASHGSGYAYDTRVPVLVRGPGVQGARFGRRVDPIDLPVTLAALAGLPPPGAAEGEVLREVFDAHDGWKRTAAQKK